MTIYLFFLPPKQEEGLSPESSPSPEETSGSFLLPLFFYSIAAKADASLSPFFWFTPLSKLFSFLLVERHAPLFPRDSYGLRMFAPFSFPFFRSFFFLERTPCDDKAFLSSPFFLSLRSDHGLHFSFLFSVV